MDEQARNSIFRNTRSARSLLDNWTYQACLGELTRTQFGSEWSLETSEESLKQNQALASAAIDLAFEQLSKSTNKYAVLNMSFIALQLYKAAKNEEGTFKCQKSLEISFQSCEGKSPIDEPQMEASYAVLNLLAACKTPVIISERESKNDQGQRKFIVNSYTEQLFKESEKLRLRAIAIVDRLDKESHLRRKAHRDMALWYAKLDKKDLSEREKQTLFDLVGIHDDSILYPSEAGCGHVVWWKKENNMFAVECGMG